MAMAKAYMDSVNEEKEGLRESGGDRETVFYQWECGLRGIYKRSVIGLHTVCNRITGCL